MRIHFHSDCSFFAGCENMLVNFFSNTDFMASNVVSFSYRYTEAYQTGLNERIKSKPCLIPLRLFDMENLYSFVNRIPFRPIRLLIKSAFNVMLLKYLFIFLNTIIFFMLFGKERIDLLHINNGGYPGAYSCMSAIFAAKLRRIKFIIYVVNNIAISYRSPLRWLDYPFDRIISKLVIRFITGSLNTGKQLQNVLKLSPSKVISIHNGIVPRVVTESKKHYLERLGVGEDRILLAVIAVLEERKGHIYLIQSIKLLKEKGYKNMPLLLIEGSGPALNNLILFVKENGLEEHVIFVGNESNVFNLLNAVDVIVLPSIMSEDFPNIVLEGMCLAKVIIASRLAGIPEQIEHMHNGILVEPRDTEGLADAIRSVAESEALRSLLGENARQVFKDKFTADIAVQKYIELFRSL